MKINLICFSHMCFLYLCAALHQAEKRWWIEDEHESGLYWWWTAGRGYHRWKATAQPTQQLRGYANKIACLVHMESQKQTECVSWALRKLESHPSLQGALNKVRNLYKRDGPAIYEKYFGL